MREDVSGRLFLKNASIFKSSLWRRPLRLHTQHLPQGNFTAVRRFYIPKVNIALRSKISLVSPSPTIILNKCPYKLVISISFNTVIICKQLKKFFIKFNDLLSSAVGGGASTPRRQVFLIIRLSGLHYKKTPKFLFVNRNFGVCFNRTLTFIRKFRHSSRRPSARVLL